MTQYIVSARKYRPDNFENLVGQDNIAKTLKNSILRGQLAHAYLFCGPRGVGKTSTARIFAKTINCSNPSADMEPCGKCESCISFAEGRSYCIHELDAASNNGVDDIKALMDQVRVPPQIGKYSVYIIDEVHMLSQAAFNAFLKTLEEPPAHAIFILATTEKHKILPTILSRCQTYDFNRITVENIVKNLRMIAGKEGVVIDDESLHVIANKADGAMRDALTIFDQTVAFCGTDVRYQDVLKNLNVLDYEHCFNLVDSFLAGDYASALLKFDEILTKGFNALYFVSALSSHLRDLIVSKSAGMEALLELPDSLKKRYKEQAGRCSLQFLYDALGITTQCESGYRASVNPRLHIEYALMRLSLLMKPFDRQQPPAQTSAQTPAQTVPVQAPARTSATSQATTSRTAPSTQVQTPTAQPASVQAAPVAQAPAADAPVRSGDPGPAAGGSVEAPASPRRERKTIGSKTSSMSINSMMNSSEEVVSVNDKALTEDAGRLPSDDEIRLKWKELAALYTEKQPRLSSVLGLSELDIEEQEGMKHITFTVANIATKGWIEEKRLKELEGNLRKLTGSSRLYLKVTVAPDEEKKPMIYMPSEKAKDLMDRNPEVKDLVKDFGLDIK